MSEVKLFEPISMRGVTLPNRIGVSPMCQYSATDGLANDWHLTHLGARAAGGAGLVIVEATGVLPEGRITPGCLGLWNDSQIEPLARVVRMLKSQGAVAGIQIGHAGRKASAQLPWNGGKALSAEEGAWQTYAPSAIAFDEGWPTPEAMSVEKIAQVVAAFGAAARRAAAAGFEVLEIHGAHGYLLTEFLSPLTNQREDEYGGGFENRTRMLREVIGAVRKEWPEGLPLFLRISATDWVEGGWTIEDSVRLARMVKPLGVDLVDCSSGGTVPYARMQIGACYQVPFANAVRNEGGIATAAVGLITDARQANEIVANGQADLVLLAREMLRRPYWAIEAAKELGVAARIPRPYLRAF